MSGVFERPYAHHYDALYGEKNYPAECDAVEQLLRRHGAGAAHSILDLGCGTGTHALILAARGHSVTGVDRSPAMLAIARDKMTNGVAGAAGTAPEFIAGDIRDVRLGRTFDAVVMLFAVLGYQTGDDDLTAALRTVAAHLRPGGVFVCDVWFGPAVLAIGTSDRVKIVERPNDRLHRNSSGELDQTSHTCRVTFKTWRETGDQILDESVERHVMRYFFQPELEEFFAVTGLELCSVRPFGDIDASAGPDSWNVWVCGRAARNA